MTHTAKHHFPWFSSRKTAQSFIAFLLSSFPSLLSYHRPLKRPWNSYLLLKSIKWTPCWDTSGSLLWNRTHHPPTEIPHSTFILSHRSMDFTEKQSKPRESYRNIR